jgi:hypothetical protein
MAMVEMEHVVTLAWIETFRKLEVHAVGTEILPV